MWWVLMDDDFLAETLVCVCLESSTLLIEMGVNIELWMFGQKFISMFVPEASTRSRFNHMKTYALCRLAPTDKFCRVANFAPQPPSEPKFLRCLRRRPLKGSSRQETRGHTLDRPPLRAVPTTLPSHTLNVSPFCPPRSSR